MLCKGSVALFCVLVGVARLSAEDARESRVVQTAQGLVRGYKDPQTGLFSFFNIPYATAPTGTDRFKAPLPPPVWMHTLEAVNRRIICPQVRFFLVASDEMQMQEDCLIVNIHVPDTKETNLPVYVVVHGGGFQLGYGEMIKPENMLTDNNVIAVTFNYRLGVHGFLCLGTEDAPGNAGMKDQVALLRWVKENIANFGGNPNDVTLGGCSAGGAAVDLLTLSKSTEGLFHKAIPESGSNVGVWSVQIDPLENAKWFAKVLNFTDVDNFYALQDFYKSASLETLQTGIFIERKDFVFVFVPCVERPTGEERFFDDYPVSIIKKGNYKKVPLLYGYAQMEGLIKVNFFDTWKDEMNENFAKFLPADLKFKSKIEEIEVAKDIKQFYFGDKMIDENSILKYINYIGDVMFAYPHIRSAQLQIESGHDNIYLYEYSFVDENDPVVPYTNIRGANHCVQYTAVCDGRGLVHLADIQFTEEFLRISSLLKQIYANFIKTGKPVVDKSPLKSWPAVKNRGAPYMSIGVEVHLEEKPLIEERVLFWNKMYDKYYNEPMPPPPPPAQTTTHPEL